MINLLKAMKKSFGADNIPHSISTSFLFAYGSLMPISCFCLRDPNVNKIQLEIATQTRSYSVSVL